MIYFVGVCGLLIILAAVYFGVRSFKYEKLYEEEKNVHEEFRKSSEIIREAYEGRIKSIKDSDAMHIDRLQDVIRVLTKERDEMKRTVMEKILKKLGPLIEETTIQLLAELGANKRAQRLSDEVITKLKKELGVE